MSPLIFCLRPKFSCGFVHGHTNVKHNNWTKVVLVAASWVSPLVLDTVEHLFPWGGRLHSVPVEYVVKVLRDKTHFSISSWKTSWKKKLAKLMTAVIIWYICLLYVFEALLHLPAFSTQVISGLYLHGSPEFQSQHTLWNRSSRIIHSRPISPKSEVRGESLMFQWTMATGTLCKMDFVSAGGCSSSLHLVGTIFCQRTADVRNTNLLCEKLCT